MTRSDAHLARHITGQIEDAACKGKGLWWSSQETAHSAAATAAEAERATRAAFRVCSSCTQVVLCRQRAELDSYTGLAAGSVFLNGRPRSPALVMPHPEPPRAEAS